MNVKTIVIFIYKSEIRRICIIVCCYYYYYCSKCPTPSLQNLPVCSAGSRGFDIGSDDQAIDGLNSLVDEVWSVLSRRQKLEIRERAGEFYRMLYNTVEQEMLADHDNDFASCCRDPYVEKLIVFLTDKLISEKIRNPLAFRRISLLSALKKRIKAVIDEVPIIIFKSS